MSVWGMNVNESIRVFFTLGWLSFAKLNDENHSDGETLPQLRFFWSIFQTQPLKANLLNLYLQGSVNIKSCLPETSFKEGMISWNSSVYKVTTWGFPFLSSPKKHQSSLGLSAHWTHKHSFSLTELTATMNLNSKTHKRSVVLTAAFTPRPWSYYSQDSWFW